MKTPVLTISLLLCLVLRTTCWQRWTWEGVGPGARRGHSMNLINGNIVLFGGRGDDTFSEHVPKTYEITEVDGKLEFSTYDTKPLQENQCEADDGTNATCPTQMVPVGTYFNDIWSYNLDCERYSDESCVNEGWTVIDAGARLGGCHLIHGVEHCTHPVERYDHSTEVINDEILVLFGGYSTFCEDFCDDLWIYYFANTTSTNWIRKSTLFGDSPGKIWRMASVVMHSTIFVFGGHRLWHGFSNDNAQSNRYENLDNMPKGGYLDDFLKLNMSSCLTYMDHNSSADSNVEFGTDAWNASLAERQQVYESCLPDWQLVERKKNCTSKSLLADGSLKPGFRWRDRFDEICVTLWPPARAGHAMVVVGTNIWLFGGYRTFFPYPNTQSSGAGYGTQPGSRTDVSYSPYPTYPYYLDDLWRYDTTEQGGYWHRVTPLSPTKPSARREHTLVHARGVLMMFGGYHANYHMNDLWYYNMSESYWLRKEDFVHALYPTACTQDGWVLGFPTRDTLVDGEFGRASSHFYINYTRNQAPGWDGCRDRLDGRQELPWKLQWLEPTQRSHHSAVYSEAHSSLYVFGGHGFQREEVEQVALTPITTVKGDFWSFNIDNCLNNCTNNGECNFGFCKCSDGYYGTDCSNTTCPGSFCSYDRLTHQQECVHCCSAPYTHTDNDMYQADVPKIPCTDQVKGESNGICDGKGTCQCRPPFIGDDCSMRDCPRDCSGNGWCSVEYPVSRCVCHPGYSGLDCSFKECINNCSYPNGECVNGQCACGVIYDPYNRARAWRAFAGMDCSYITPFASAARFAVSYTAILVVLLLASWQA